MSEAERVTDGGEVRFVTRIIEESAALGARVTWFTSLLGRKSSVRVLLRVLAEQGALAWR